MEKDLTEILDKLRKANETKDSQLINRHVDELNKLWEENAKEMIDNGKKDGFHLPKKTHNEN
jgi:hypothetical protein